MGGLSATLTPAGLAKTNYVPEIYTNRWNRVSQFTTANMPEDISYYYPGAFVLPVGDKAGKIFYSTTALKPYPTYHLEGIAQIFDPFDPEAETGHFWTPVGGPITPKETATAVLLPIRATNPKSKVLVAGGWWVNPLSTVDIIDLTTFSPNPLWTGVPPLTYARYHHNAVLLPDRSLFIVGGNTIGVSQGSVLIPELLDTDTLTWFPRSLPSMPVARNYHSTALLLPNGKVFVAGGRVSNSGDVEDDTERRISLFKPGYLLDGEQPRIDTELDEIIYGNEYRISVSNANSLDSIALLKTVSTTHGNDMSQRYIELSFTPDQQEYKFTAPANSFIAPPGYYMLFVLKHKSESISGNSRIPSNAIFVKLKFS